jgi:hypothetical protein
VTAEQVVASSVTDLPVGDTPALPDRAIVGRRVRIGHSLENSQHVVVSACRPAGKQRVTRGTSGGNHLVKDLQTKSEQGPKGATP